MCGIFPCLHCEISLVALACGIVILWPRDQACISCFGRWILNHYTTREVLKYLSLSLVFVLEIYFNSYSLSGLHKLTVCMVYIFPSVLFHLLECISYTQQVFGFCFFFIHSNNLCFLRHKCLLRDGGKRRKTLRPGLICILSILMMRERFWTLQNWEWIH